MCRSVWTRPEGDPEPSVVNLGSIIEAFDDPDAQSEVHIPTELVTYFKHVFDAED